MQKIGTYRRLTAWAILLVFLAGWSMGTMHRLLRHHDHTQLDCSANYDAHSSHLHDDRYAHEHCALCAFVLSTPDMLSITALLSRSVIVPDAQDSFQCIPCCTHSFHDTTFLRGPPVL